jgi:hypothetical protein
MGQEGHASAGSPGLILAPLATVAASQGVPLSMRAALLDHHARGAGDGGGIKPIRRTREIPPQRPTPWLGISDSNFDVQREESSSLNMRQYSDFPEPPQTVPSSRENDFLCEAGLPERTLVKRRGQCSRFITSEFESSHGTRTAASIRIPRHRDSVPAASFVRSRNDRAAPKRAIMWSQRLCTVGEPSDCRSLILSIA